MPDSSISRERRERVRRVLAGRLASMVVIIETVRTRHNTSAILRTAEAFGLHEVHMVTGTFRPARGASRGAERWLELHRHAEIAPCIEELHSRGFRVLVADLADDAFTPETAPVDRPIAILLGSETVGVSEAAKALADGVITVPMEGLTESLNVSTAAACLIHRVSERRRAVSGPDLELERQEAFYADWVDREEEARLGARARTGEEWIATRSDPFRRPRHPRPSPSRAATDRTAGTLRGS
jgi:tRNA (guanosine-2'-O-)-methyltransferase